MEAEKIDIKLTDEMIGLYDELSEKKDILSEQEQIDKQNFEIEKSKPYKEIQKKIDVLEREQRKIDDMKDKIEHKIADKFLSCYGTYAHRLSDIRDDVLEKIYKKLGSKNVRGSPIIEMVNEMVEKLTDNNEELKALTKRDKAIDNEKDVLEDEKNKLKVPDKYRGSLWNLKDEIKKLEEKILKLGTKPPKKVKTETEQERYIRIKEQREKKQEKIWRKVNSDKFQREMKKELMI